MGNKTIPAVIVGVLGGLILGFFGGIVYQSRKAPSAANLPAQVNPNQALPENHPSKEDMERMTRLREQASRDPNDKDSRTQLGNIFYDLGQYEQAIHWYAAALELDPKNVNIRTDMGTAYHFLGQHDRALQEYSISLSMDPTHAQTLQNMGWVKYSVKKDYNGALQAWNELLRTNPSFENAAQVRKQIEQVKAEMEGKKG